MNIKLKLSNFKSLIDKYPEQSVPKNGDAIYHGGFPIFNSDGTYREIKITKKGQEFTKIETTEPTFTLRFRLLKKTIFIGWSSARQEIGKNDNFDKEVGRTHSLLQLLRNCNDIFEKDVAVEGSDFLSLKSLLPVPIFANLKYYIDKYVRYSKIDINAVEFIICDKNRNIYEFTGHDISKLSNQYMPKSFYRKYTK